MVPSSWTGRRQALRLIPLATLALLAGCAQEGDFGRPKAGAWNSLIETTGTLAAREREEPASTFPFTDEERACAIAPGASSCRRPGTTRSRTFSPISRAPGCCRLLADRRSAAYHDTLMAESFRSPVSRYRRLSEDIGIDARLIPQFAALAMRVKEGDALRLRSLPFAKSLDDGDVHQAAMRVAENRCLIAWVRFETDAAPAATAMLSSIS